MNSHTQQVVIGLLAERATGERSVALIPSDIKRLLSKAKFLVESGAGQDAGFEDNAYVDAGALIADSQDIFEKSDVVLKVRPLLMRCRVPAADFKSGGCEERSRTKARQRQGLLRCRE